MSREKSDCLRETDTEATVERLSGGHLLSPAETQVIWQLRMTTQVVYELQLPTLSFLHTSTHYSLNP